jgi:hypothetical protein
MMNLWNTERRKGGSMSNYGPKGYGLYDQNKNQERKKTRTGEVVEGAGKNTGVRQYTSATMGTAKQQARAQADADAAKNKKQPVKTVTADQMTPEQRAAFDAIANKPKKLKKEEEVCKYDANGQWSLEKRCWEGYKPVPGKKAYEKGSCEPVKKSDLDNEAELAFYDDGTVELDLGSDVNQEFESELVKSLTESGFEEDLEKKEWSPKAKHKSKSGGLTAEGVASYRRANPGSKLKTAVTEKNPGGKRAKRRRSFCARNKGQIDMHNIDCRKDPKKRACLARKKWRC